MDSTGHRGTPNADHADSPGAFSIGEAAAIVGVSTHVLRSWERRLSLDLNHRTTTNQRRYWIEDIQRFIAIRQLHESDGLPLGESAARAVNDKQELTADSAHYEGDALDAFWAGLIDTLGEILLVIDETGQISAANEVARAQLRVRQGTSFIRLAPIGWRPTYHAIKRGNAAGGRSTMLAMRARAGIIFVDARVVPVGPRPDGPAAVICRPVSEDLSAENVASHVRRLDA